MRLYISGPMSNLPDLNFPAFAAAALALRAEGLDILSAHEIAHDVAAIEQTARPWEAYLREDLAALLTCEGIVLLPGWPESAGARLELEVALRLRFLVFFYDDVRGLIRMSSVAAPGRPLATRGGTDA